MHESFIDSLPTKVRCTDDFEIGTKFRSKNKALDCLYLELNQLYRKFIALDIDRPGAAYLWDERNLPAPTYVMTNPSNGHCHYLYELRTPVYYTEAARRAPQKYLENIDLALTHLLGADLAYVGKFVKNPLHPHWYVDYHPVRYDLEDFKEWGVNPRSHKRRAIIEESSQGRNHALFNSLRNWAYVEVHQHTVYGAFQEAVDETALNMNKSFIDGPKGILPFKEVLSTSKSVGTWTWRRRETIGQQKNRGVMQLAADMSKSAKQAAGASYAHANNSAKQYTRDAVVGAAIALKAAGIPITQQSVAIRADVSVPSVRRFWNDVDAQIGLYRKLA